MYVGRCRAYNVQHLRKTRWSLSSMVPEVSLAEARISCISFDPCDVPVHPGVYAWVTGQATPFTPRHHSWNANIVVVHVSCSQKRDTKTHNEVSRSYLFINSCKHTFIHSFFWRMFIGKIARKCLNNWYWNNGFSYLLATEVHKSKFSFINVELFASLAPLRGRIMNYTVATQEKRGRIWIDITLQKPVMLFQREN